MATAAAARGRKTRTGRTATARPAQNFQHFSSASEDSSTRLRIQFLTNRLGLSSERASLVAALAFGGAA